jgi:tetratricopeptide (TPR) repeat protein
MQAALDTALNRADSDVKARFEALQQPNKEGDVAGEPPVVAEPHLLLSDRLWNSDATEVLSQFLTERHELSPDIALRLSHEWRIVEPPQVVERRSGRRVGARLASLAVERADVLRRMDDFLGGGDMHDLVRQELHVTLSLTNEASYTEQTGRSLLGAIGELAQLAGWVASDAGLHAQAERYYLGGVSAAHAAGDEPLAGHLLSSLSYQVANVGDPREAVLLATTAYKGAEDTATPTVRALLLERVAWTNAQLGDAQATTRALAAVDDAFVDSSADDDPAWAYWLSREEIDVMAGRCATQLKRPGPAIELLTQAIKRYDGTHAREMALYLSWLAEAYIYGGNVEEAAATALRALHMSNGVTSARSNRRIQHLRSLLAPYHGNSAVDEFEEEARGTAN